MIESREGMEQLDVAVARIEYSSVVIRKRVVIIINNDQVLLHDNREAHGEELNYQN